MSLESLRPLHRLLLEASADQPSGEPQIMERVKTYIQELLERYPELPENLAHSEHAGAIRAILTSVVEAQSELDQIQQEAQRQEKHINELVLRVALTKAMAQTDLPFLRSIISSKEAEALFSTISDETSSSIADLTSAGALPTPKTLKVPRVFQEKPARVEESPPPIEIPEETPSSADAVADEITRALSTLGAPQITTRPEGEIIETDEIAGTGPSWKEILGENFTPSDQQLVVKIMDRLTKHISALEPYVGDSLGAIQKLPEIDPEILLLALQEEYTDGRSLPTLTRFLSLYWRISYDELLPRDYFLPHAQKILTGTTESLLPEKDRQAPHPSLRETIREALVGEIEATPVEEENSEAVGTILELFREFYAGVEANNFQGHWPVEGGRLAVILGKLSTNVTEKAIKDGVIKAEPSKNHRDALNERDALSLLYYKSWNLEQLGAKRARTKLNSLMRSYWEARAIFAQEYREKTGKELPYPGLEQ